LIIGGNKLKQEQVIHSTKKLNFTRKSWLLIIGIIFIAFTLRSPLTTVGPIISLIRDDLGISNVLAGFITTIPLLAFAIISPFAPKLSRRFGMELTLFASLCILTVGIIIRSTGTTILLLIGTFLIGVAIAFGNVLLPGLLKLSFPLHIGLMTGIYSMSMNISATIASGISVPIAIETKFGWQGALGVWVILTIIAIIIWLPQLKNKHEVRTTTTAANSVKSVSIWRSPIAWSVTFFMGLQSLLFYTSAAWIPEVLKSDGLSASGAGWMFSLLQLAQLPMMFIIPIIADKIKDQRKIVFGIILLYLIGYGGILSGNISLTPLWMIVIGFAGGASFGLTMMFFTLRTRTPHQAAELSGMAQSFGYLLAAVGPVLFGYLHDLTNGWTIPMFVFIIGVILLFITGLKAGKDEYIFPANQE